MSIFLQLLLRSFETGAIYALEALGIIIIFRTSLVVNYSQGVIGMFGAYAVTTLFIRTGIILPFAVLAGVFAAILVGVVVDFTVIRHTKSMDGAGKQITTLGLLLIFLGITPLIFGTDPLRLPRIIEQGSLIIGGANLSYNSLLNISFGLALTCGLFILLQKTKLGLGIRATASNSRTARLLGIPTARITLLSWSLAAVLATLSGVMIAPATSVTPNLMDYVHVNALIACVLGGFSTFYGPAVAAYLMAVCNNMLMYYVSSVWGNQLLYLLIVVFIIFKPVGLFGKRTMAKI